MSLTDKEKRIILSPLSFSSKQRKNTKFRTRKKIQEILSDMNFLIENHSKIFETFEIDVLGTGNNTTYISESKIKNTSNTDTDSSDPDLL